MMHEEKVEVAKAKEQDYENLCDRLNTMDEEVVLDRLANISRIGMVMCLHVPLTVMGKMDEEL